MPRPRRGCGGALPVVQVGLAKEMLTSLAFLGDRVRWDWHVQLINYDDPHASTPEQFPIVPTRMRPLAKGAGSGVKLAVFEEDGAYYARLHGCVTPTAPLLLCNGGKSTFCT